VNARLLQRVAPVFALAGVAACSGPQGAQSASQGALEAPAPAASLRPRASSQPPAPPEAPPRGKLPADVRPTRFALTLEILPAEDRFSGSAEIAIELGRARDVIWLHGIDLAVKSATVTPEGGAPIRARWEQGHPNGVAALRLDRAAGPGKAAIRIDYDAAYGTAPQGLYRVERGGDRYAFTHFEPVRAREVFPCFDEPAFKVPMDLTLIIPKADRAVANGREIAEEDALDGKKRVRFAATQPIPTYLIAFAVGPLDIVTAPPVPPNALRARPLALRGVAAKGRGPELSYALARMDDMVAALEQYFGSEYPYDKLDVIAVPERYGAMENIGAITFSEWFLLVDEKNATSEQRQAFAEVATHEIAHTWLGDLVTMPWWDDLWLKESSATWMSARTNARLYPELDLLSKEIEAVHGAMNADSLKSARRIRQDIAEQHDIYNAFDDITYAKGGAVLRMFERWIGEGTFQKGIQAYLSAHRHGSATASDLLDALGAAASRDVAGPFRSFLLQPGVPFIEAGLDCGGAASVTLKQSRYLPLGSKADAGAPWQIPVCVRYPKGDATAVACSLLTEPQGKIPLEGGACPAWIHPNADAAGYYRWSLASADRKKLSATFAKLSTPERLSFAESLKAGFQNGTLPAAEIMAALPELARDPHHAVAAKPIAFITAAREWLEGPERAAVDAHGRALYAPLYRALGWTAKKGAAEDVGRGLLREAVVTFLALTVDDPAVRKEATRRARAYVGFGKDSAVHPEALDPGLASVALSVAVQEEGQPFFDALVKLLEESPQVTIRRSVLAALSRARDPKLAARARELVFDPRVHSDEVFGTLFPAAGPIETRAAFFAWFSANIDKVIERVSLKSSRPLPFLGASFCDSARAEEVKALFEPRIAKVEGGPRNLAAALEHIELCAARRAAHIDGVRAFYSKAKGAR
jgi:alanyl aminopeptidase